MMENSADDKLFADRLIERFGEHAAVQTRLRIQELEEFGEAEAAALWRRALVLIEFGNQDQPEGNNLKLD